MRAYSIPLITLSTFCSSFIRNSLKSPIKKYKMSSITPADYLAKVESKIGSYSEHSYVDVHAHLIHDKFTGREDEIVEKCINAGLEYVVVNGLEPISNRAVLNLCEKHNKNLLPAIGIYPLDAACNVITSDNWKHEFPPPTVFDVDAEIDFIDKMATEKKIIALGECGIDKHYLTDEISFKEQERVLRKLMQVAKKHDLPIILHTRKAEKKVFEMLLEEGVKKADFHCFCGKTKLGVKIAEAGYYLSIPSAVANADQNSSFKKLAAALPLNRILTETDSPYMGPDKGEINDPSTVPRGLKMISEVRGQSLDFVRTAVRQNFEDLFNL